MRGAVEVPLWESQPVFGIGQAVACDSAPLGVLPDAVGRVVHPIGPETGRTYRCVFPGRDGRDVFAVMLPCELRAV